MRNKWAPTATALLLIAGLANGLSAQENDGPSVCPVSPPPAPFTDIDQLPARTAAAVSCIVYYGITAGTTPTSYSPEAAVTRSQMARFLTRTAAAVGVDMPDGEAAPFDDLGGVDEDGRLAVDRLWRLGITRGAGSTAFEPQTPVPRRQMALFLSRMLEAAEIDPAAGARTPPFTDLGGLPQETVDALRYLAGLGVEWSAAAEAGRFEPARNVTRSEMALLLAASLKAGGARPLRLKIELSSDRAPTYGAAVAEVTVTKPNGDPYPGVLVDVFASQALLAGGRCQVDRDSRLNGGDGGTSEDCRIDRADPRTDSNGRVRVGLAHSPIAEAVRIYAWTGSAGQEYREAVPDQVWAEITWFAGPNRVEVDELKDKDFGTIVTVTARLVGQGAAGQRMIMEVIRQGATVYTRVASASFDGGVRFAYRGPRDPSSANNDPEVVDTIKVFWDRNRNGVHDGPAELSAETTMVWDD